MRRNLTKFIAMALSAGMIFSQGFSYSINVRAEEPAAETVIPDLTAVEDADTVEEAGADEIPEELSYASFGYDVPVPEGASTYGDFSVEGSDLSGVSYAPAGPDYKLQYWNVGNYKSNGVLTLGSGTYSISMAAGKQKTTDRIKIKEGATVNLTINNLNIEPNQTDGYSDHYGQGRPFDMKSATVTLNVQGTNTFRAPAFSTALFCPSGSNLTVTGNGTLNAIIEGKDYAVAAIGGEGKNSPDYTKDSYGSEVVSGHDQLARIRIWPDDEDSKCGTIVFDGNMTVNAKVRVGDPGKSGQVGVGEYIPFWSDGSKEWCIFIPPVPKWSRINALNGQTEEDSARLAFAYYSAECAVVAIGGAYDGNITVKNGNISARAGSLGTGIGSVNRSFGKVKIEGGTVTAESGYATDHTASTDYVGFVDYGPAIGWVRYSDSQPSNMEVEITGGKVTAKSGYGAAGIGGGIDSTGGTIKISGGTVVATGGDNGAGIGGGIGQSVKGNTTDQAKIIITGGTITATGGINAAGIGGGGNNLGADITAGHSGDIVISGNANVTATGGPNAPGIGAGGSGAKNPYQNACKVQSIVITTTGKVTANAGSGALTNIGSGNIGDTALSEEERYKNANIVILTPGVNITGNSKDKMSNLITVGGGGKDLVVKGSIDLTTGPYAGEAGVKVTESIAEYLKSNPSAKITSSGGGTTSLKLATGPDMDVIKERASEGGVTVNDNPPTRYNVTVSVGSDGGGTVSGNVSGRLIGENVTVTATPADSYRFVKWTEGGNQVSLSAIYTFSVKGNHSLVAVFERISTQPGPVDPPTPPGPVDPVDPPNPPGPIDPPNPDDPEPGKGIRVVGLKDIIYTGQRTEPSIRLYDGNHLLVEGRDYSLSYKNNINAWKTGAGYDPKKQPTIIVRGLNNYSQTFDVNFDILPRDIADDDVAAYDMDLAYTGRVQKVTPVIYYQGKALKKADYTVIPETVTNVGTTDVTVKGTGNFTGTRTIKVTVKQDKSKLISQARVTLSKSMKTRNYDIKEPGKEQVAEKPGDIIVKSGNITLESGTHYEIEYRDNVYPGTATILIVGKGEYSGGTRKVTFTINGAKLAGNLSYDKKALTDLDYTGEPIVLDPDKIILDNGGEKLTSSDFDITYQNNKKPGTAKIIFKGKNLYKGSTLIKTFKINKYDLKGEKVAITVDKTAPFAKGGAVLPGVEVTFGGSTLMENVDYTVKYSKNKSLTKDAQVTISGKGLFTGRVDRTFEIKQQDLANLVMTVPVVNAGDDITKKKFGITDLDGKALKAGTDYDPGTLGFYSDEGCTKKITAEAIKAMAANTVFYAKIDAADNGSYKGSVTGSVKIGRKEINKAVLKVKSGKTFSYIPGKAMEFDEECLEVTLNGKTLKYGDDFEVISGGYRKKLIKGNAVFLIRGKRDYCGVKQLKVTVSAQSMKRYLKIK